LELDPLNIQYNSNILFNRACAFAKTANLVQAIGDLDSAININDEYAKAYLKRGDLRMHREEFEEAVRDYERVKQLDPCKYLTSQLGIEVQGLREKIHTAKLELKKSKRKDYYKLLDIPKSSTPEEIKKSYKKSALKWHPDKHNMDTEEEKVGADKMFKDIGEAYSILSDP
jgi:DnaJ family protein C protein 7